MTYVQAILLLARGNFKIVVSKSVEE